MTTERERKFKTSLDQARILTYNTKGIEIEQLYLSPLGSNDELRIRKIGTDGLFATLKQGSGERREETEVGITPIAWRVIGPQAVARVLKTRYYLDLARNITLDTYPAGLARHYGLLEIEESLNDDITDFDPYELGAGDIPEVTGLKSASNRHLATPLERAEKTATATTNDLLRAVHAIYDPAGTPQILTIGGPSASGKSTLLKTLQQQYGSDITILTSDNYYIGKTRMQREMPTGQEDNFDHPRAIDTARLASDLSNLQARQSVTTPIYDMLASEPLTGTEQHSPTPLIVVEGLVANHPELRKLSRLSAALDAPLNERLVRRIERDRTRKAHTPETTMSTFLNIVEPSYHAHYAGFDRTADLHIDT